MSFKIELSETDFLEVASNVEKKALVGKERVLQNRVEDRSPESIVEDLLPSALAIHVSNLTPPDFELSEITIDLEVSGKVFGSGISGSLQVKLSKRA